MDEELKAKCELLGVDWNFIQGLIEKFGPLLLKWFVDLLSKVSEPSADRTELDTFLSANNHKLRAAVVHASTMNNVISD